MITFLMLSERLAELGDKVSTKGRQIMNDALALGTAFCFVPEDIGQPDVDSFAKDGVSVACISSLDFRIITEVGGPATSTREGWVDIWNTETNALGRSVFVTDEKHYMLNAERKKAEGA
jgi:hypothetical protein